MQDEARQAIFGTRLHNTGGTDSRSERSEKLCTGTKLCDDGGLPRHGVDFQGIVAQISILRQEHGVAGCCDGNGGGTHSLRGILRRVDRHAHTVHRQRERDQHLQHRNPDHRPGYCRRRHEDAVHHVRRLLYG